MVWFGYQSSSKARLVLVSHTFDKVHLMAKQGQSRQVRRELARKIAKEILSGNLPKNKQRRNFLWMLISIFFPLGWELFLGDHQPWRIIVGWILWLIPLSMALRSFWYWCSETHRPMWIRLGSSCLALFLFAMPCAYSITIAMRPTFVLVWPGLVDGDGITRSYYTAAKHLPLRNVNIVVSDNNDVRRQASFRISELDPRRGGIAEYFRFQPSHIGHERLTVFVQSADGDSHEQLSVEDHGRARFPALQAIVKNSRSGEIIFQCESREYPFRSGKIECGNDLTVIANDERFLEWFGGVWVSLKRILTAHLP